MSTRATHAYVGHAHGCGCIVAAVVDIPGEEESTAEAVAEFITSGLTVERLPNEVVRQSFGHVHGPECPHREPVQASLFAGEPTP